MSRMVVCGGRCMKCDECPSCDEYWAKRTDHSVSLRAPVQQALFHAPHNVRRDDLKAILASGNDVSMADVPALVEKYFAACHPEYQTILQSVFSFNLSRVFALETPKTAIDELHYNIGNIDSHFGLVRRAKAFTYMLERAEAYASSDPQRSAHWNGAADVFGLWW